MAQAIDESLQTSFCGCLRLSQFGKPRIGTPLCLSEFGKPRVGFDEHPHALLEDFGDAIDAFINLIHASFSPIHASFSLRLSLQDELDGAFDIHGASIA